MPKRRKKVKRRPKPGWFRFEFHTGPGHQSSEIWYEWLTTYELEEAQDEGGLTDWLGEKLRDRRGYDTDQWTGGFKRAKYIPTEDLDDLLQECRRKDRYHRHMAKLYKSKIKPLTEMMFDRKITAYELRARKRRKKEEERLARANRNLERNGLPPWTMEEYLEAMKGVEERHKTL